MAGSARGVAGGGRGGEGVKPLSLACPVRRLEEERALAVVDTSVSCG